MEKIKLLAIDLDGTSLDSNSQLSEINRQAILKAFENDIEVVVASGRGFHALPEPLYSLPFNYMILKNGGIVLNVKKQQEIYHDQINPDDVYEVLTFLKTIPGAIQVEYDNKVYRDTNYANDIPNWGHDLVIVDNVNDYIRDNKIPVDKLFIACKNKEDLDKVMAHQKENINVTFMDVGFNCVDVCSRMCSKGYGLKILAKELNINKNNIAAIGDSDNDMIMLTYSALSFAPSNGSEFLKSYVDVIAPSNDDNALAYAIDYIIERNKKA